MAPPQPPSPPPSRRVLGIVLMPVISLLWVTQSGIAQWIFGTAPLVDSFIMSFAGYLTRCVLFLKYIRPSSASDTHVFSLSSPSASTILLWKTVLLCAPLGFLSNWAYYAGLSRSTLASSSTLSSTATLFALIILSFVRLKSPMLLHVFASFLTVIGVGLIFLHDSSDSAVGTSATHGLSLFGLSVNSSQAVNGDLLTLFAALLSGAYSVTVQATFVAWCGPEADADKFVALNGLFISLVMMPWFMFKLGMGMLPPAGTIIQLCVNALFGEVLNGMIWTRCTKWVSPLVTSLTSALLVPMSVIWDLVAGGRSFKWTYVVGTVLIIVAFVFLCFEEEDDEEDESSQEGEESSTAGGFGNLLSLSECSSDETTRLLRSSGSNAVDMVV